MAFATGSLQNKELPTSMAFACILWLVRGSVDVHLGVLFFQEEGFFRSSKLTHKMMRN